MSRNPKPESSSSSSSSSSSNNTVNPKPNKNEKALQIFEKIVDFVSELNVAFGTIFHEVAAYNHLLSRTKISQKLIIRKHVELFREFCERNRDALLAKDFNKIISHKIIFSERAFLNLHTILSQPTIDSETSDTIWTHLLVISALVDPTVEVQEMLKKLKSSGSPEGEFLDNFFTRIQSVDTSNISTSDPMTAASAILQSGVLNDLVGSIDKQVKDGSLDFGKLLGTVQTMLGSLSGSPNGGFGGGDSNPLAGMNMGGLGGMLNMMMSGGGMGGMAEMLNQTATQSPNLGANNSTQKLSEVDKMKNSIEARIEAQAQLEMAKMAKLTENSVPKIQLLEDDSKTEQRASSASSTPN
jgi:hypothetical protein